MSNAISVGRKKVGPRATLSVKQIRELNKSCARSNYHGVHSAQAVIQTLCPHPKKYVRTGDPHDGPLVGSGFGCELCCAVFSKSEWRIVRSTAVRSEA